MTQLDGCIGFWESKLKSERWFVEPSTISIIEATIKFLKKLKEVWSE